MPTQRRSDDGGRVFNANFLVLVNCGLRRDDAWSWVSVISQFCRPISVGLMYCCAGRSLLDGQFPQSTEGTFDILRIGRMTSIQSI
jgi:hypothetical protein